MALEFSIPGTDIEFELDLPNPADYAKDLMTGLKDFVGKIFGGIGDFFMNAATNVVEGIGGAFGNIKDSFVSRLKTGFTALAKLVKSTFQRFI